ncbi:MAG: 5'/3'-nucleotidase SurE [Verrucomicrobiota bacterium]
MFVLITNDDGIDALGIQILRDAVRASLPGVDMAIVAPAEGMSQVGHRVTTAEPISVRRRGESEWAVDGTPADCVRLGAFALLDRRPDWVFSGVNRGGNLGQDIPISGTLAAAREAAFHGIPSIGFSQRLREGVERDWERTKTWTGEALRRLTADPPEPSSYWSVNFPDLNSYEKEPSFVRAVPETRPLPVSFEEVEPDRWRYTGVYGQREKGPGSDVEVCFRGDISMSLLQMSEPDLSR